MMYLLARDAQPVVAAGLVILGLASAALIGLSILLDLTEEALEVI